MECLNFNLLWSLIYNWRIFRSLTKEAFVIFIYFIAHILWSFYVHIERLE